MAEIHMEKKRGGLGWLWLLLALLIIALLAWMFWPDGADDAETETVLAPLNEPYVTETATTAPAAEEATIAAILANPEQWVGREFAGTVSVVDVPTDRGFWIEQNGQRMFALIVDEPREVPMNIQAGQQLQIRGTVRDQSFLPQLPGEPLTAATESVIQQQRVYLVAGEEAIQIQ